METTIKRELTINQMVKLFDIIYVKLYEPSYLLDKNREVGRNEKIFFDITIRHNPKK